MTTVIKFRRTLFWSSKNVIYRVGLPDYPSWRFFIKMYKPLQEQAWFKGYTAFLKFAEFILLNFRRVLWSFCFGQGFRFPCSKEIYALGCYGRVFSNRDGIQSFIIAVMILLICPYLFIFYTWYQYGTHCYCWLPTHRLRSLLGNSRTVSGIHHLSSYARLYRTLPLSCQRRDFHPNLYTLSLVGKFHSSCESFMNVALNSFLKRIFICYNKKPTLSKCICISLTGKLESGSSKHAILRNSWIRWDSHGDTCYRCEKGLTNRRGMKCKNSDSRQ